MYKYYAIGLCIALLASQAGAVLIEKDWKTPGDALLTVDTDTGLEWLDVTESRNQSYNAVVGQFGPGGDFEGFAHATVAQIEEFWHNAGITVGASDPAENAPYVPDLMDMLGGGYRIAELDPPYTSDLFLTRGFSYDIKPSDPDSRMTPWLTTYSLEGVDQGDTDLDASALAYNSNPSIGHWLIRPVPEPATLGLLALGMVAVAWRQRK